MVNRLGLSAQSVHARFLGSVAAAMVVSSAASTSSAAAGEEDEEEDEDDDNGTEMTDEGDRDVDDKDGEGEDEDEDDEAGPMATERTLRLPLMVMGTLTWMRPVEVLRLRRGGGLRICWRRRRARRSPLCSSASWTAEVCSAMACCTCNWREERSTEGVKKALMRDCDMVWGCEERRRRAVELCGSRW